MTLPCCGAQPCGTREGQGTTSTAKTSHVRGEAWERSVDGSLQYVEVRYFAAAADAAGVDSDAIALTSSAILADLRTALIELHGLQIARVLSVAAFLVGGELTREPTRLTGPEVDVLPPFAGG